MKDRVLLDLAIVLNAAYTFSQKLVETNHLIDPEDDDPKDHETSALGECITSSRNLH